MYKGYRSKHRDGMDMVWLFYAGQQNPEEPSAEIRIGPFADEAQYAKFYPEIIRLADEAWAQGRASEAAEHEMDAQTIDGYRERWVRICALQDRINALMLLASDAWLSKRTISPEELRDALQGKEG